MDDDAPDDFFWEDLLVHIEAGKVVPIVGSELVTIDQPEGTVPLYRHVAGLLAQQLKVPLDDLGEDFTLNDVVSRFLGARPGRKKDVYARIVHILKDEPFKPSPALLSLAGIAPLNLFVSTTFDNQLANAINAKRFGGNPKSEVIVYSTKEELKDLPAGKNELQRPVVYQLLGKLSAAPGYVVCDEDMLEFLHNLQDVSRRPKVLFDALRDNHLLILGCNFPDWLSRFFLRLVKAQQLSDQRDEDEILVDVKAAQDGNLSMFLSRFSSSTRIIPGSPAEFVAELARRWHERHPEQALLPAAAQATAAPSAAAGEMEAGAVFLSYASDDVEVVERIKTALEAAGVDVWFDKNRLGMGDDWDRKIKRNIDSCGLCVPVVSRQTEARAEGYFRREWAWAVNRAEGIADEVPFLVPVSIDETQAYTATVPERFKKKQWALLPSGQITPEFAENLKQWQREFRKRQQRSG